LRPVAARDTGTARHLQQHTSWNTNPVRVGLIVGSTRPTFDAFITTAAEYNHGATGVLKNAFDSAFNEWVAKPISFIGYGTSGGARAVEQLRLNVIELQIAPIRHAVHINMEPFVGVLRVTVR
jgi:hypothetical protein